MGDPVYDPFAYDIHEDPYPTYRRLRDEVPAYHNPERGFWALSRYQDIYDAMHDWQTYSSADGVALERASIARPPMIIAMDPPRQVQLRKLVSKAFTPRRIAMLEPSIRALARKYLGPLLARGGGDFIAEFSARLPMDVISTMLGIPESDQDQLRAWSDALLHREEGQASITDAGQASAGNLVRYFAGHLARARSRPGGDDLMSALVAAELDGERLTDAEINGFCFLLVIAGNETTTKMLGNAIVLLDRHREQRRFLVAHPERIVDAVEEVVRYDNSTQMLARTLTHDVDLHGRTMPGGARVLLLLGSGNRDERAFDRPDEFDIHRPPRPHLAFGYGMHVCLGASLARLEGRVALEELHARASEYTVDARGLKRVHSPNVRGYAIVPVTFGR